MEVIEEGVIEEGQDARPLGHALWVGHDHVNESWHAVTQVSVVSTVNVPHYFYLLQGKQSNVLDRKTICKITGVVKDGASSMREKSNYFFVKILEEWKEEILTRLHTAN